jgi:transcriptional regulator with XRE-family HTH domain
MASFGYILKDLLNSKHVTEEELSSLIKIHVNKIKEWEDGNKTPNRDYSKKIIDALQLTDDQAKELLLSLRQYPQEPTSSNIYRPTGILIDSVPIGGKQAADESQKRDRLEFYNLRNQLAHTQKLVNDLSTKVEKEPKGKNEDQINIGGELQKISEALSELKLPTQNLSAQIVLPPPEDMEVRLVSSTSLQQLEEYRSEENKWFSIMSIFIGALLGIAINVVTGGVMKTEALILVFVFIFFVVTTFFTARNYQQRGNYIKSRIFREQSGAIPKNK